MTGVQVEEDGLLPGVPDVDRDPDTREDQQELDHQAALFWAGFSAGAALDGRLPAAVVLAGTRA